MGWMQRTGFLDEWHAKDFSYGERVVVPHALLSLEPMIDEA
jgi:hypothetical protein